MTRYAQVIINLDAPLESSFHYHLPADLEETVQAGHLVEVEFGRRLAQGIVAALDDESPVPETKPIIGLVMPDPVLSEVQLELAHWLSDTYLAPLIDCLRLMLPPGLSRRADTTLELVPGAAEGQRLTEAQGALVDLLRERGDLRGRQISRLLPQVEWRPAAEQLVRRGLLRRGSVLDAPRARPKQVRTVQLIAGPQQVAATLPTLGKPSKQAQVLEWLAGNPDPFPSLPAVCEAVGCSPGPIRALADVGHVLLTPGRTLLAPLSHPGTPEPSSRASAQLQIMAFLERANAPVVKSGRQLLNQLTGEEVEFSPSALRALVKAGTVVQIDELPAVSLAIPLEEVPEAVTELRGGEIYRLILALLSKEAEPVDVSGVYAQTGCQLVHLNRLADAGLVVLGEQEVWRDPLAGWEFVPDTPPTLTVDQARVWGRIKMSMLEGPAPGAAAPVYLLHGVTGSGKTEIYLRAIHLALGEGRGAIVLVPEIALTPQTVRRFSARFAGRVAVLHSRLSAGERYDTWRRVRQGMVDIVIGPRSALFAPLPDLGVIVVDEEHDEAYKQDPPIRPPHYHAREVAIQLAHLTGATVIMGSATPDLVSYHRARRGEFHLLELPLRIMGHRGRVQAQAERYQITHSEYRPLDSEGTLPDALTIDLPPVELVDMRQELRAGNRSIFSRALTGALTETLALKQQAILFLNRRGTSTFVFCRDCGLVLKCPRCDMPLTYHRPRVQLVCHYCGRAEPQPEQCPRCRSRRVKFFGLGTEGVENEVLKRFPDARVLRWDRDTTGDRGAHDLFLQRFVQGQADVLVGTQMIAKGLDLPLVTLVGVISADVSLGLPDYRTGERTFQVLTQVAGRAGRGLLGGRVLLQTFNPEHYAIRAAAEHDYAGFYLEEIEFRSQVGYPPYKRLARLEYRDPVLARGRQEAERLVAGLREHAAENKLSATEILGPTQPFFGKVAGRFRWHIVIRAPDPTRLLRELPLPDGWQADIDPMSLL
jgi:primosomal protein N' (replication factor Y)